MEIANSEINNDLGVIEEDNDFYERIEAPKFVDFTVPDRSRPDDRSWFCDRIGCDQQHEEIDHDALYKNFVYRVMAARSPNVKLQRALSRQVPRLTKNCPHSAPAKSAKDRVSRLSTVTSIPDKLANTRLMKDHPVSSLRSTPKKTNIVQPTTSSNKKALMTPRTRQCPNSHELMKEHPLSSLRSTPKRTNAAVQPTISSNKKALTTLRTKQCLNNHEMFRSMKHQKASVNGPKSKSVAKVLFLQTPKTTASTTNPAISDICDGMKNLNTGCDQESSSTSVKETEVSSLEGVHYELQQTELNGTLSDCSVPSTNMPTSLASIPKETLKVIKEDAQLSTDAKITEETLKVIKADAPVSTDAGIMDDFHLSDENKENSFGTCGSRITGDDPVSTDARITEETLKVIKEDATVSTDAGIMDDFHISDENKENSFGTCGSSNINSSTTNSENVGLFETCENILQKDVQVPRKIIPGQCAQGGKPKRTTNPKPFRLRTDERGILKEANLERRLKLEAQKETLSNSSHAVPGQDLPPIKARVPRAKRVRFVEARYANINPKYQKVLLPENKKEAQDSESKSVKIKTSRQLTKNQSEEAKIMPISKMRKKDAQIENKIMAKGSRSATIPTSSRHLPKSSTRRPEMAMAVS